MEQAIQQAVDFLRLAIGSAGGIVIVYGVVRGLVELALAERRSLSVKDDYHALFERIRYDIGLRMLFGLEFLVAADLLRTVVSPTLQELAVLGGIVAIRTVISYFLGREINRHVDKP